MKRIVLTASLVAVITVVLVVVGVAVVDNYLNRIYDAKFVSADGETGINFEKVSKDEVEQIWGSMGFYPIDNETFYEKYIADNPKYLYSAEVSREFFLREKFNEKLYVFVNEKHYFFVKHGDLGVTVYDGMCFLSTENYSFNAHIPCVDDFSGKEETFVPWEDSVGLSSYEDLLVYYSRLSDEMYRVDEENKTLYLSVYNKYLGWMESGVKLEVSDTGFKITLMPEIRDMKVE